MRKSSILFQQHAGKFFQRHWKVQGKRVVRETGANTILKERGISVVDALNIIKENKPLERPKLLPQIQEYEEHQVYCPEPCLVYKDHNVLLEGLEQAKLLTNTVEIELNTLPSSIKLLYKNENVPKWDQLVKRIVESSLLYDTEQKKLPKRTDPEREAWNFPRDYGITDSRRNLLMCKRLMQLCSSVNPDLIAKRKHLEDGIFCVPIVRNDRDVLVNLRADSLVLSSKPIKPISSKEVSQEFPLPNLKPLLPIVSLEEEHMYRLENIFPLNQSVPDNYIHTALVHYNNTEVGNLFETEVTESQILGRSLMKCFAFAVAQARNLYGDDALDIPTPVVVQSVQTDSQMFHFSVFQLNTLSEGGPIHNMYWSLPIIHLFKTCEYVKGRPVLDGYNPDVFKWLCAFYQNK